MVAIDISVSAEKIFSLGFLNVNNSMITSLIATSLILLFALAVRMNLKKTNHPTGIQNLAEMIVDALYSLVHSITHNETKTKQLFPLIATFFIVILVNNWLGLIPGVGTIGFFEKREVAGAVTEKFVPLLRAGTTDLNMTIALGLISVIVIQIFGVKYQHLAYFKKFINLSNPINFFIGVLEIVSELSRIISFAFRLFGNIFAGEVLLVVMSALTKVVAPMPFYGMEIFVGFIQALVFAMLSVVLMNMATVGHDSH